MRMMLCERTEDDVTRALEDLSSDAADVRQKASEVLETCALKHETLLKRALEQSQDAEVRARLSAIVDTLPQWKKIAEYITKNPDVLKGLDFPEARALHQKLKPEK